MLRGHKRHTEMTWRWRLCGSQWWHIYKPSDLKSLEVRRHTWSHSSEFPERCNPLDTTTLDFWSLGLYETAVSVGVSHQFRLICAETVGSQSVLWMSLGYAVLSLQYPEKLSSPPSFGSNVIFTVKFPERSLKIHFFLCALQPSALTVFLHLVRGL